MKQFDVIFEEVLFHLRETNYVESTFEDNIRLLVKILIQNGYMGDAVDVDRETQKILEQRNPVKEIVLDTKENSIPAIKLHAKQPDNNPESFSVTVISLEKPEEQKEFTNSMLETIFEDVIAHIKTLSLQELSPDSAVEELPKSNDAADSQPGPVGSQLPTGEDDSVKPQAPILS